MSKTTLCQSDSTRSKLLVPILQSSLVGTGLLILNETWYKNSNRSSFHTFNDAKEWLQMDKFGHIYSCYQLSVLSSSINRYSGTSRKKSALWGAGISWGFMFGVEFLDGKAKEWGFSIYDIAANTLGASTFLIQELIWEKQKFNLKFSYRPSPYASLRPTVLGNQFSEKLLKDYNAQTYWLSTSIQTIVPKINIPKWIGVAVGYSATGMLTGHEGQILAGIPNQERWRRYHLSLDLDFSKIPTTNKTIQILLRGLNLIKLPFPSIVFDKKGVSQEWSGY